MSPKNAEKTENSGKTADAEAGAAPKRKRGRGADPEQTKTELIEAAIKSLIDVGYSGTTARSIATRANCNQAAIYYHFGGIEQLLIAALEMSSRERLARYTGRLSDEQTLTELIETIEELYVEDRESGHLSLLTELVGGITATPELRAGIENSTQPWLEFVEARIKHASKTVSFGAMLPSADIADLVFSLVIGVELRNKVDGNDERSDRLFRLGKLAAQLAESSGTTT